MTRHIDLTSRCGKVNPLCSPTALAGKASRDTRVEDIMTSTVLTVSPKTSTDDCMALMSQKKIRHLPVVDGEVVLGMISIRDLMDDIILDREQTISQLQSYIAS